MEFLKINSRLLEEKPIGDKLINSVILCKIASDCLKKDQLQLFNCPSSSGLRDQKFKLGRQIFVVILVNNDKNYQVPHMDGRTKTPLL